MENYHKSYSIRDLNELLNGNLIGDTDQLISGPEQIESATPNAITFIGDKKYIPLWQSSRASAALVNRSLKLSDPGKNKAFIEVENADLAMAKLLELFIPPPVALSDGHHPSAVIHDSAEIGKNVTIGAHVYIGANVTIGANATIFPNVSILDDVAIGEQTLIKSGTVIGERCIVGSHCILHANVSIGTDGFGYRPSEDGKGTVKIPHIGNVIIGNYVEIGSSSCVDRGKFSSTTIGDGTKIDNLVQIAHNCKIGRSCLIAALCGISGSVTLGDGVTMAGQAAIKDHITIGNGVTIGGRSGVMNDIPDGKTILGYPAIEAKDTLRQWAMVRRLAKK